MKSRIWVGVILIAVGAGFLLENTVGFPFGEVFEIWWPLILVAVGVVQIINRPNKLMGGLVLIGLGGLLIANHLTGTDFWATALPLGLILFGIGFLLRDREADAKVHVKRSFNINMGSNNAVDLNDEVIDISAVFSGTSHRINSSKFRGGRINSLFGGVELDLRSAEMASTEASLDIDCTFGGVEIKVPQSWKVVVQGTPIFGGIQNDTIIHPSMADNVHTLTVRASVAFGGMEIKN